MIESLQSQLNNFTLAVFGPPEKIDVAPGIVEWIPPCGLEPGLLTDPKGFGEGVSCYFLRLFRNQIADFAGKPGAPGVDGAAGNPAYALTASTFSQPVSAAPFALMLSMAAPIRAGEIVYITNSGWYNVLSIEPSGLATLSLLQPMLGASGLIPAGRFVIPTGPKGADQTGATGDTGHQGDKGPAGDKGNTGADGAPGESLPAGPTQQTGAYIGDAARDFFTVSSSVPDAKVVSFDTDPPTTALPVQFTLTVAGKYLFRIASVYHTTGSGATLYTGLVDTTTPVNNVSPDPGETNTFLPGSYTSTPVSLSGGADEIVAQSCIVTTSVNYTTIEWRAFGKACRILPGNTTVLWIRLT